MQKNQYLSNKMLRNKEENLRQGKKKIKEIIQNYFPKAEPKQMVGKAQ